MSKDLIKKFSIYSVVIISIFGIMLNLVMDYQVENMVMERSRMSTVSVLELHANRYLTPELFNDSDYNKNKEFFYDFYLMLKTEEIVRIKVFDKNGMIIYSDENELIGQEYHDNDELGTALGGVVKVEINRDLEKEENFLERKNYSGLMEIYVPIRSNSDEVYGVIELYQVLDSIDEDISDLQLTIAIISFFGLFLLYISLIWIVKDASETIMKQNIALKKSYDELKEIDKMKNHFINSMSHELRTPLNAVIGFSDILMQNTSGELNEKQRRYVDNILQSGKHLLVLINDILDMIVIEAGKMELSIDKTSVNMIIDENIQKIKPNAEKNNVSIIKEIDPNLEFIEVDKHRFSQILLNLLDNAVKFSKKEGGIVKITANKINNNALFSISDNGIGIKEKDLDKLFKVFQQLDMGISRKYGGTGMGLSISKKLVELHGGKMFVESKYGEGTTFSFELPLIHKKEERSND